MNIVPINKFLFYSMLLHMLILAFFFFTDDTSDHRVAQHTTIFVNIIEEEEISKNKKFNQQDDISTLSKDNKSIKSPVDKLKINQGYALEKRKFSYDLAEEAKNQSPKNKESKKRIEEKLNITKEKLNKIEEKIVNLQSIKQYDSFVLDNHYVNYKNSKFNQIKIIPEYPSLARVRGIQGKVILKVTVDESMKITKISLDRSSGSKILDSAALKAARKIKNTTYMPNGTIFPTEIKIPITFSLSSG